MDTTLMTCRPDDDKRIWLVDAIRGLAVFGILWVNIFLRSDPIQTSALPQDRDFISGLVLLTGNYKFRCMFAFLFGLGMAMQSNRASDESAFVRTYLRRLFVLMMFGVMHFVFLWPGDILAMYAVAGMLLVWFRNVKVKTLLALAFVSLLVPVFLEIAHVRLFNPASLRADVATGYAIYRDGGFWEITQRRVYDYVCFWAPTLGISSTRVFAMMLLGVVFEQKQYFRRAAEHVVFWRRLCWVGYMIGIPANALFALWRMTPAPSSSLAFVGKIAHIYGAPLLCLAYVATMVLLSQRQPFERMIRWLAPIGRMSMTSYLTHSIVCGFIFYGYGLQLFGTTGEWTNIGIAMGLCLTQLVFAEQWFRYFKMGPIEWVWRWATHGTRPVMRFRLQPAKVVGS